MIVSLSILTASNPRTILLLHPELIFILNPFHKALNESGIIATILELP